MVGQFCKPIDIFKKDVFYMFYCCIDMGSFVLVESVQH